MENKSISFLNNLMNTWGPSGYEHNIRKIWKDELKSYCDKIKTDYHGNIYAVLNEEAKPTLVMAGHIDEIGFQVRYIDDNGFIYFRCIGGIDLAVVQARKVIIHSRNGDVKGVIGRKAIHLMTSEERTSIPKEWQMFIDIGAKDKKEASSLIEIGDPITYDNSIELLRNNIYCSRAFDDKLGAFIIAEVMKNLYKRKNELKISVYALGSCQEELRNRGAISFSHKIKADIGIAIDGTFSVDIPDSNPKKEGEVKLGKGPALARGANTNPLIFDLMLKTCKEKNIQYQLEAEPSGNNTDADFMQTIMGCAAGLISIPLRYMHTQYEVMCMTDVENTIKLLTELCLRIDANLNLIP